MFNFLKSKANTPINKGYKVALNSKRSKKYGIASKSLQEIRTKIEEKFELKEFNLFLHDGILIEDDEYFQSIPAQSLILVALKGEQVKTEFELAIETFRKINNELLEAKHLFDEFVANNENCDFFKALSFVQAELEDKIVLSSRVDDPEWFEGILGSTKEEVMRRKAADRIKGYFYKTKDELTKSPIYRTSFKARKIIDDSLLSNFFLFLNGVDYFSCLFDRSHKVKLKRTADETDAKPVVVKPKRRRIDSETKAKIAESDLFKPFQVGLSDERGNFSCHGAWNTPRCVYQHQINPYASKQSIILFSIYNLDHQIEISRSIFPSILKNVEELSTEKSLCPVHQQPGISLSVLTYFSEIFTVKNLKLVQIVCHDKSLHQTLKSKGGILCKECAEFKKLQKIKLKVL